MTTSAAPIREASRPLQQQPTSAFYRPSLDGLRFFAFFAVFLHHSFPHDEAFYLEHGLSPSLAAAFSGVANAGAFGVDLFFVLSAYLITELLLRERDARGTIDLKSFYIRRALRIWPLHYTFLGFALLLPLFFPSEQLTWKYALGFALFSGNWLYVFTTVPTTVAVLLWSVSVEEQFYLVWPIVVRTVSRRGIVNVAVGMLVFATLARFALASLSDRDLIWNNTLARLDPLATGALLAVGLRGGVPVLGSRTRATLIATATLAILVVARFSGVFVVPGHIAGRTLGYQRSPRHVQAFFWVRCAHQTAATARFLSPICWFIWAGFHSDSTSFTSSLSSVDSEYLRRCTGVRCGSCSRGAPVSLSLCSWPLSPTAGLSSRFFG